VGERSGEERKRHGEECEKCEREFVQCSRMSAMQLQDAERVCGAYRRSHDTNKKGIREEEELSQVPRVKWCVSSRSRREKAGIR
jgi:hypothetical protein